LIAVVVVVVIDFLLTFVVVDDDVVDVVVFTVVANEIVFVTIFVFPFVGLLLLKPKVKEFLWLLRLFGDGAGEAFGVGLGVVTKNASMYEEGVEERVTKEEAFALNSQPCSLLVFSSSLSSFDMSLT
jgi:hypothetical protein